MIWYDIVFVDCQPGMAPVDESLNRDKTILMIIVCKIDLLKRHLQTIVLS